jgi:GT2 family glycosyltransferase
VSGPKIRDLLQKASNDRPWFYFDDDFYIRQCIETGLYPPLHAGNSYLRHYLDRGARAGLSPNPLFDEAYYRGRYADAVRDIESGARSSGFEHFVDIGAAKDLSPAWFFDGGFYKRQHQDLTDENLRSGGFLDRYSHYLLVGIAERRAAHWTVQALQTIKPDAGFPSDRSQLGAFVSDSSRAPEVFAPMLDYDWMKEKYGWGRSVRPEAFVRHYVVNANTEKLSPSPYFDEPYYRAVNRDIDKAIDEGDFACGYEHFLAYGMKEWRRPFASFDPRYYFANNMEPEKTSLAATSPFTHFLRNRPTKRFPIARPLAEADIAEDSGQAIYERRCMLNAGRLGDMQFAAHGVTPDVSIIIVAQDNYDMTANCIVSAAVNTNASFEVVVFDNASSDETRNLNSVNPAIKYLRAETNVGFTIAVNRAAKLATGRMILLLNNDTEVTPRAIDIALDVLQKDPGIGAVGAKLVRMHGRLQEGGSIVWRDGTCLGYARDGDPSTGQVSFVRNVDFCSGCFLAFMRADWEDMGGFDEAYAPAYYEETDFCLRVWQRGKRVVYDPRIVVWHFEFGSSAIREEPLALMRRNQRYFAAKHRAFLTDCLPPSDANVEPARLRHVTGPRVLFIEDVLPDPTKGMGQVRSAAVARVLEDHAGLASVLGLHNTKWPRATPGDGQGRRGEVLTGVNILNIVDFFRARTGVYDHVWLSRTHNLPRLREWRAACPEFFANVRIILDAEAIAATRRFAYAQQANQKPDLAEMVLEELEHLDGVKHIFVVNELDRALVVPMLEDRGLSLPVSLLGHSLRVTSKPPRFEDTSSILLLGSYTEPDSPNVDALLWFDRTVRPLLGELPGLEFVIAGSGAASFARTAELQHHWRVIDGVPDIADVLRTARVMVAPTRFAAGIPMKVHEAASHGVPCVMTDLLARQLGWRETGVVAVQAVPDLLAQAIVRLARNPDVWHNCQQLQAKLVAQDCDPARFEATIREVLGLPAIVR